MADHPMIFSAPMILALLAGRKTQTRRLIKPQPTCEVRRHCWFSAPVYGFTSKMEVTDQWEKARLPAMEGDRLWVREAHKIINDGDSADYLVRYAADGAQCWRADTTGMWVGIPSAAKRASIYMSRWASRLTLTVTQVRVQRLLDISEDDAVAEGCFKAATGRVFDSPAALHRSGDEWASARDWYMDLWETLHGPRSWDAGPWVVALTFGVTMVNIDALRAAPAASPIVERVTA